MRFSLGEGLALFSAACLAMYGILAKKGMAWGDKEVGALITLIVNNLFNLLVLLCYNNWGTFIQLPMRAILFYCGAGLLTSYLGRLLLFNGIERIGPSRAGTFKVASPIYTVLVGIFILGETLSKLELWGILLTMSGLFLVSYTPVPKQQLGYLEVAATAEKVKTNTLWGITYGLLSGLAFSAGNIFRKAGMNIVSTPIEGTAIGSLIALLGSGVYLASKGKLNWREIKLILPGMKYFVAGGVLNSIAVFALFYSLRYIPVSLSNVITAVEPVFLVAFSYLLLRKQEVLRFRMLTGALCSVVGVILIIW